MEGFILDDIGRLLQQVGDPAEDTVAYTIGMEALEQQERLEVGVGGDARRHSPGVGGARAMELGRDGSQRDGRRRRRRGLRWAAGHRMRLARWARRAQQVW